MADFVLKDLRIAAAVLLLVYFCCSASGQLPPENFTVQVVPTELIHARDSTARFVCLLSFGAEFRQQYQIRWLYVSTVPGLSSDEKVLAENDTVINTFPGKYSAMFAVEPQTDRTSLEFTINNVTDTDDGRYLCRVVPLQGQRTQREAEALLAVQHEAEKVTLEFVDKIGSSSSVPVYLAEGAHDLRCEVYHFNPRTDYKLFVYIGDIEVHGQGDNAAGELVLAEENSRVAGAPRWRLKRSLSRVHFALADSGKDVSCVAQNKRLSLENRTAQSINVTRSGSGGVTNSPPDGKTTRRNMANAAYPSFLLMAPFPLLARALLETVYIH